MSEVVNRLANSPLVTFRTWAKEHDWTQYQDKHVAITCSVDAIIQTWVWMILEVKLHPYAKTVVFGTEQELEEALWRGVLDSIDWDEFQDRPVVLKGCSDIQIPVSIYVEATRRLMPRVKKLSFGEPCSTVPVYKRPLN